MLYMVTFTINIPQMLAYIPYMDPVGYAGCLLGIPIDDSLPLFLKGNITHELIISQQGCRAAMTLLLEVWPFIYLLVLVRTE